MKIIAGFEIHALSAWKRYLNKKYLDEGTKSLQSAYNFLERRGVTKPAEDYTLGGMRGVNNRVDHHIRNITKRPGNFYEDGLHYATIHTNPEVIRAYGFDPKRYKRIVNVYVPNTKHPILVHHEIDEKVAALKGKGDRVGTHISYDVLKNEFKRAYLPDYHRYLDGEGETLSEYREEYIRAPKKYFDITPTEKHLYLSKFGNPKQKKIASEKIREEVSGVKTRRKRYFLPMSNGKLVADKEKNNRSYFPHIATALGLAGLTGYGIHRNKSKKAK